MGNTVTSIAEALLRGFGENEMASRFGPTWQQDRALKEAELERTRAQNAALPSPEEAAAQRDAQTESTLATAGVRKATAENLGARVELARAQQNHKMAMDAYTRDPSNPANQLRLAQAKAALATVEKSHAEAALASRKATNPELFRAPASMRPQPVSVGGEMVLTNFNPRTGEYLDTSTGQPVVNPSPAPTTDMRNREAGRALAGRSISLVKSIGDQLITKVGPAQRAVAAVRGVEAAFGNDPTYRTYQDARMALAGNLAVAQQGSRPSDADVRAIWLPLVPDVFRDTADSAPMKWNLIYSMSGTKPEEGGPAGPAPARPSAPSNPAASPNPSAPTSRPPAGAPIGSIWKSPQGTVYRKVQGGWQKAGR